MLICQALLSVPLFQQVCLCQAAVAGRFSGCVGLPSSVLGMVVLYEEALEDLGHLKSVVGGEEQDWISLVVYKVSEFLLHVVCPFVVWMFSLLLLYSAV